jgi:hypothetical protein
MVAMAVAVALLVVGFVVGVLSVAVAEAAAFLWAIRNFSTTRPSNSSNSRGTTPPPPPPPLGDLKRQVARNSIPFIHSFNTIRSKQFNYDMRMCGIQGFLWILDQEKTPSPTSNAQTHGIKDKKTIVEVFPVKMLAKLEGRSLTLSAPDASHQTTIHLMDCAVVAVSASNLPSRKWLVPNPFSTFLVM